MIVYLCHVTIEIVTLVAMETEMIFCCYKKHIQFCEIGHGEQFLHQYILVL